MRVAARERERRAVELPMAGYRFEDIGRALGVSKQAAHQAVGRAMARTMEDIAQRADELRAVQAERIEAGIRGLWPAYTAGEGRAVDRMVRLLDRQARLLGLDLRPPDATVDVTSLSVVAPWGAGPVAGWAGEPAVIDGEARAVD